MTNTTKPAVLSLTAKDITTSMTSFALRSVYYDLKKHVYTELPSVLLGEIAKDKEAFVAQLKQLISKMTKKLAGEVAKKTAKLGDKISVGGAKAARVKVEATAEKTVKLTVGGLVKRLLLEGLSTEEVLAEVSKAFPEANTNAACISWYRCDLKKKGLLK